MNDLFKTELGTSPDVLEQFRLVRIQTFNWGTFPGVTDYCISPKGYLFVGPSGSGKSTVLDANAALTTPPKWVSFNAAAREGERQSKDRTLLSYVRGAYAQQTASGGEVGTRFLREDTTWTVIAQTYRDGKGNVVVLAQVLWIRGKSVSNGDVKRVYLVLEKEFDVRELQFFAKHDFDVRRFKSELPDVFAATEFSAYQERFRRLLGIDTERALRLLHKTQSAKTLGDLDTFMREFMLDAPETFELAARLVDQFQELNEAHRTVVDARRQIETLMPARAEHDELDAAQRKKNQLDELSAGVDAFKEQRRKALLEEAVTQTETKLEGMKDELDRLTQRTALEYQALRSMQDQRNGMGGGVLERMAEESKSALRERGARIERRQVVCDACDTMGWARPETAIAFAELREQAHRFVLQSEERRDAARSKYLELFSARKQAEREFAAANAEIQAMERQRSNIPAQMLLIRARLAAELGVPEERLPFAGELTQVRSEEADWQGATERVLRGFALSVLVEERFYAQVAAYVNATPLNERFVYLRMMPHAQPVRPLGPNSLVRKLEFTGGAHADWVREQLKAQFDYECAPTVQAFRNAQRAITMEGQVKHGPSRHEKNDRHSIHDRQRWVLGFDNTAKLKLYKDQALAIVDQMNALTRALDDIDTDDKADHGRTLACNSVVNRTWEDIDVAACVERIATLEAQIAREQAAHPGLAEMDRIITAQEEVLKSARDAEASHQGAMEMERARLHDLSRQLDGLRASLLDLKLTPFQRNDLGMLYQRTNPTLNLSNLDSVTTQVVRALNADEREVGHRITTLGNSIASRFKEFNRQWPAESGGLDPTFESAPDYFAKLQRLETDGLPRYEERFLRLLRDQSDQNLTRLYTQLDQERRAIRERLAIVNESLTTALFNPGTHLVIETHDRLLDEVVAFRQQLRASLSHSLSVDPAAAEQRFEVLNQLVKRFASQETADLNWKALVLDVRQHVEFIAREFDADGVEIEVYRSGEGKSGGQRQKLAATCLAAALRYQLGGQDRALPRFAPVFLDEAFERADSEFTRMSMNIFNMFGFQMIVATPLKAVMTLEPFIGGAVFVHNENRKNSSVVQIAYDEESQRLKLSVDLRQDVEEAAASA